ncbi:replication factor C subunit 4-like [Strongylocentrotus purpuratus]|uniref:Replication factor C subunit 2 n=1 Tax=Strongylocentrotus purpuratus TaxID=7668 RepID=A0A7M7NKN7_STRPU|nr:replication factor C subunit 4 [Strongylocentrotus purpuratus]XP_030837917.1 replication factor C subunit 4-like [Strongylocentrotus purpuratus]XP_030837919.1 replication factor C subunit 4-like [Strongylocentrotus purpuratus]|eukprot:XP_011663324.1 PREDICTED: replication factor C subunit 4 [Strongylocentrotus purpuratus]
MDAFLKGGSFKSKAAASSTGGSTKQRQVPWVEKYRPRTVDEVAYQDEVVAVLKKSLQGADLPNMLFYGPPGTGKTSTILAASRELFGTDMYRSRVLELNASDERGIQVVRDKVKKFAQTAAGGIRPDGKPCPPFKIIILDEADSMTYDAQAALRRTMEKQSKNTKFCLICNYISRIIEPLTSRCSKFRFKPLSKPIQGKKLREICEAENINCGEEALEAILKLSEGDMRKSITFLQSVHRLQREDGIRVEDVYEIAGVIPDKMIDDLIQACYGGSYEKLDEKVQELLQGGYSASQVVNQIFDIIVDRGELTDKQKSAIAERLAVIDKRLCDGADEGLQIMDLFTLTMDQFCTVQN